MMTRNRVARAAGVGGDRRLDRGQRRPQHRDRSFRTTQPRDRGHRRGEAWSRSRRRSAGARQFPARPRGAAHDLNLVDRRDQRRRACYRTAPSATSGMRITVIADIGSVLRLHESRPGSGDNRDHSARRSSRAACRSSNLAAIESRRVRGQIVRHDRHVDRRVQEGCWMRIQDDATDAHIRMAGEVLRAEDQRRSQSARPGQLFVRVQRRRRRVQRNACQHVAGREARATEATGVEARLELQSAAASRSVNQ